MWGSRLEKYNFLSSNSLQGNSWNNLSPAKPYYLFRPTVAPVTLSNAYRGFTSLTTIFPTRSTGVQTSRDKLVIGFSEEELRARLNRFAAMSTDDEFFRRTYFRKPRTGRHLRGDTRGWNLPEVRQWARVNLAELQRSILRIAYRPFDTRYVIYHPKMIDWPRREVMQHLDAENVALLVPRQLSAEGFHHSFCTNLPSEMCVISTKTKEQNYVSPLWLYSESNIRVENLSSDFRMFLDARYDHHYAADEIFGYIYAVLHAPTFRSCYAEFLRIDFPRVPFPEMADDFETLSGLGWALVQAHLLRELPRRGLATYHGRGDHYVQAARYTAAEQAITINKTQYFKPVPQMVWDFHIGGYQVLDKYLKSRTGLELTLDEIDHVGAIADSLAFTIEQMARIDEAYKGAFPR
jgi:predicted helicase